MKIVVIYNICGISGRDNLASYIASIHSLLNQSHPDSRVVISSCRNTIEQRRVLMREFGNRVSYWNTDETRTVNVTCNLAFKAYCKHFGEPDGMVYCDSGVNIPDTTVLPILDIIHRSWNCGMTAAMASSDDGLKQWYPDKTEDEIFDGKNIFFVPVGKTINLHFQIFDKSIWQTFGRPWPDIFASHCSESTFSFLCVAVQKRFAVTRMVRVEHCHGMDGGSSGFSPEGLINWKHLLPEAPRSMDEIIKDPEAKTCGFGYEECFHILDHDQSLYDARHD